MRSGALMIAGLIATLLNASFPAAAPARVKPVSPAQRLVAHRLASRYEAVRVKCTAPKGASKTQHCSWLAFRRGSSRAVQCSGRYRVVRRHRLMRAIALRRRCGAAAGPGSAVTAPGQQPAAGADRPALFGFNDNAVRAGQLSAPADAGLAARAGANLTRVTFDWRYAEPSPRQYDLSAYDAIYRASLAKGIRPLWIVMFAPRWAWAPG